MAVAVVSAIPSRTAKLAALQSCLAPGALLCADDEVAPYECDGLSALARRPLAVALPASEADVVRLLRCCHLHGIPVVARGAGTGLSGGALPHPDGLLLSLARLNRVLAIDFEAGTARVEPGVRNQALTDAAAPGGLYYAPDPSSQIACTIGGNVAENSGGVHCLKYGLTLHNVIGLRGYTIEGDEVVLGVAAPDGPGLDLLPLVVGSEGMLLVIVEVTVRLLPKPPAACVAMASFPEVGAACEAVAGIIAAGIIPAGLELMDRGATAAVEPFCRAGYDLEAAAILLVESDGTAAEVEEEIARIVALVRAAGASAVRVSSDEAERLRFWSGRKNAFPAAGRISPDYYCMDGTIPRKHLSTVLQAIDGLQARYGLRCINVFHAGDGNLHPLILFDANVDGEWSRAEAFGAEILERCVELGGTITGEHGVGEEKLDSMCVQFSTAERAAFAAVKAAFDPPGLLNPGKVIPTLHRCAEYGRVRVHRGKVPFADLERF